MKLTKKLIFSFLIIFLFINTGGEAEDSKQYWGRTDDGVWEVRKLSEDTSNFTFGWDLPEAKATKEAFEKNSFNPTTLKSTSVPKNVFVHRIGTHSDDDYKVHIMSDDSILYYGTTNGTVVFEDLIIPNKTKKDLIIIKTDSDNNIIWNKQFGSNYESFIEVSQITSDGDGNIFVAGRYTRKNSFGDFELPQSPWYTGFVTKINSDGEVNWVRIFEGNDFSDVGKIALDSIGNPVIELNYTRSIVLNEKLYRAPSPYRLSTELILKLDTEDGSTKWIADIQSSAQNFVWDLEIDQQDNIFITGRLSRKLVIDGKTIFSSGNQYNGDGYLLKLDNAGKYLSHISFPGPTQSYIMQVGFLSDNSPFIRGGFFQGLKYKSMDLYYDSVSNYSNGKCCAGTNAAYFIAKLDENLDIVWHKQISPQGIGGYNLDSGVNQDRMAIDKDDNVYLNYRSRSSAYVGLFEHNIGNYSLEGDFYYEVEDSKNIYYNKADIGILKIDKFGNEIWLSNFVYDKSSSICRLTQDEVCTYNDYRFGFVSNMELNSKGELYVASVARKPLTFEGVEYPVYGNHDTFIHKILEINK